MADLEHDETNGSIWVRSDITADGNYLVSIEGGPDRSFPLDRDTAVRHATGVLLAAQYADYDAAILDQFTSKIGMPFEEAVRVVQGLRADRPELDPADTAPLTLNPCVGFRTRKPYLEISWGGVQLGQWSVPDAKQHALYVLYAVSAVDLDAAYCRYLVGQVGIDEGRARAVVEDVAQHRTV